MHERRFAIYPSKRVRSRPRSITTENYFTIDVWSSFINRPWKRSESAWLYDTIRFDYESSIECTISFDKKRWFLGKKKKSTIKDNVTGTRERKVENGNPFSGWVALRFSKEMVAYVSVPTYFTTVALRPSKYLIRALRGRWRRLYGAARATFQRTSRDSDIWLFEIFDTDAMIRQPHLSGSPRKQL